MPNEAMRALIARRRKGGYRVISENGKGKLVPIETEAAGDGDGEQQRVVDGTADGGKGRTDDTAGATDMNKLLRSQWVARAGTIKADV